MSVSELEARRAVDARLHGLKAKLGKARASATEAPSLREKVERYREVKAIRRELDLLHLNYWAEVARLERGDSD